MFLAVWIVASFLNLTATPSTNKAPTAQRTSPHAYFHQNNPNVFASSQGVDQK